MRGDGFGAMVVGMCLAASGCASVGDSDFRDRGGDAGGDPSLLPSGLCAADDPPPECEVACDGDDACGGGFHCGAGGTCTAECTADGGECAAGEECSADGACQADCPDVAVTLTPVIPTVILLIDQSGSMTEPFGDTDRWEAVKHALTDPVDGVLPPLDGKMILGASLYSWDFEPTCPALVTQAAALGNADEVAALLEASGPSNNTPTAEAVAATAAAFPAADGPRIMVLATDGDPDTCDDPDSNGQQGPRDGSEAEVQAAHDLGIETFVLSVGDDATASHLDRLARAGVGQDLDTGAAAAYVATSPDELVAAFEAIIGGATTCFIEVDAVIDPDRADEGTVELDGDALVYEVDWRLADGDTIELLGAACDAYRAAEEVAFSASFPCGGADVE